MESVIRFVEERVAGLADDAGRYGSNAMVVRMTSGPWMFWELVSWCTALRQLGSTARAAARNTNHCCLVDALKRSRLLEIVLQERAERRFGHSRLLPGYLQHCGLG